MNQDGEVLRHRDMPAAPGPFLQAIAPSREDVVVCVECLFPWAWLADRCAHEGIPFVLGHALYMKAIHGGTATNDRLAAHKIAVLLRGGMIPQADVYPAELRATRDLRRRRLHRRRHRAGLLAHSQKTHSQYNLPQIGKKLAYQANRGGVAERFADPAVQQSIEVDLTRLGSYDRLLTELEREIVNTAKGPAPRRSIACARYQGSAQSWPWCCSTKSLISTAAPGGRSVSRTVVWSSAPKHLPARGTARQGPRAATRTASGRSQKPPSGCLRNHPAGPTYRARLAKKHGQGKALTVLAHQLARAVYDC